MKDAFGYSKVNLYRFSELWGTEVSKKKKSKSKDIVASPKEVKEAHTRDKSKEFFDNLLKEGIPDDIDTIHPVDEREQKLKEEQLLNKMIANRIADVIEKTNEEIVEKIQEPIQDSKVVQKLETVEQIQETPKIEEQQVIEETYEPTKSQSTQNFSLNALFSALGKNKPEEPILETLEVVEHQSQEIQESQVIEKPKTIEQQISKEEQPVPTTNILVSILKDKQFDVFFNFYNCFNKVEMPSQILIKEIFPTAIEEEQRTNKGDKSKLGFVKFIPIDNNKFIANGYIYFNTKNEEQEFPSVSYPSLYKCFSSINEFMTRLNLKTLVIPRFDEFLGDCYIGTVNKILKRTITTKNINIYLINNN